MSSVFFNTYLNTAGSGIASVHNIALLVYHIYIQLSSSKKSEQKTQRIQWLSVISLLLIAMYSLSLFSMYIMVLVFKINIKCDLRILLGLLSYISSKFILYILLIERLFVIFKGSQYRFSNFTMNHIRIIINILFIYCITNIFVFTKGKFIEINSRKICKSDAPIWFSFVFSFIDIMISIFVIVLFSRRLWLLSINTMQTELSISSRSHTLARSRSPSSSTSPPDIGGDINKYIKKQNRIQRMNKRLLVVMRKTNLLSIIAVVTTQIAVILSGIIGGTIWTIMDSMVNCWCILLMFQAYQKTFDYLCKYAMYLLTDQCLNILSCYCSKCCIPKYLRDDDHQENHHDDKGKQEDDKQDNNNRNNLNLPSVSPHFTPNTTNTSDIEIIELSTTNNMDSSIVDNNDIHKTADHV